MAQQLKSKGYTVIKIFDETKGLRGEIDDEIKNMPELKPEAKLEDIILGGFSAFGNPSSFHNETVRKIRSQAHPIVRGMFREYDSSRLFEQIIDRLMVRPSDRKPTKEMWHRDVCPDMPEGDTIFGGWVNLDSTDQTFSCCPGTHDDRIGKGFAKISKDQRDYYKARSVKVRIPPGHAIIFNEDLVHEVHSEKRSKTSYRLFLGWRLTNSPDPLLPGTMERLDNQAVMQLKSHQMPRIYAKLHWVNWKSKLKSLRKSYIRKVRIKKRCKKTGKTYKLPHDLSGHMKSLKEYGLRMYRSYSREERDMHRPQKL
jgi:hypothetical protein